MQIFDFTVPELDMFRNLCNFTEDEREYFELRAKGKSNVQIAMEMNVSESKVSKLARKVKSKMFLYNNTELEEERTTIHSMLENLLEAL